MNLFKCDIAVLQLKILFIGKLKLSLLLPPSHKPECPCLPIVGVPFWSRWWWCRPHKLKPTFHSPVLSGCHLTRLKKSHYVQRWCKWASLANHALDAEHFWKKTVHLNHRVDIVIQLYYPPKEIKTQAELCKDRHQVMLVNPIECFSSV